MSCWDCGRATPRTESGVVARGKSISNGGPTIAPSLRGGVVGGGSGGGGGGISPCLALVNGSGSCRKLKRDGSSELAGRNTSDAEMDARVANVLTSCGVTDIADGRRSLMDASVAACPSVVSRGVVKPVCTCPSFDGASSAVALKLHAWSTPSASGMVGDNCIKPAPVSDSGLALARSSKHTPDAGFSLCAHAKTSVQRSFSLCSSVLQAASTGLLDSVVAKSSTDASSRGLSCAVSAEISGAAGEVEHVLTSAAPSSVSTLGGG